MKKLLVVLVLFLGAQAQAGFIAEPYLGYSSSTLAVTDASTGVSSSSSYSGFEYGARLGYRFG